MGRKSFVTVGLITLATVLAFVGHEVAAEEGAGEDAAWANTVWERNCQACHAVPDPAFETDRAFLGRILETT